MYIQTGPPLSTALPPVITHRPPRATSSVLAAAAAALQLTVGIIADVIEEAHEHALARARLGRSCWAHHRPAHPPVKASGKALFFLFFLPPLIPSLYVLFFLRRCRRACFFRVFSKGKCRFLPFSFLPNLLSLSLSFLSNSIFLFSISIIFFSFSE